MGLLTHIKGTIFNVVFAICYQSEVIFAIGGKSDSH